MTEIIIVNRSSVVPDWPTRARRVGLRQAMIARLLGWTETGVSLAIRRVPCAPEVQHAIVTWEIMSPMQRADVTIARGLMAARGRQHFVSPGIF